MNKICSFLLALLVLTNISFAQDYSTQANKPENIQVLLAKDSAEALLEAKGSYVIFNPQDGLRVTSGLSGKRFMVRATPAGVKWGEEYPGIHQIYIVPKSKNSKILVNGIEYDGAIAVYKVKNKINIINDVNIESYLKATLTPQFPFPLENEVIASIAIAARTTAYSHVKRNKDAYWHISKEEAGYHGTSLIQPDSHISKAVDRTKHLILILSDNGENRPFAALWTEHSAGKTAAFHSIYRKDWWAPKKGVEAPHAQLHKNDAKWSYSISKKELANLLEINAITEIDLYTDKDTQKAYGVKVKDKENTIDIDFVTFQSLIGNNKILSNDLKISIRQNDVIFSGYGKGLGVGLCLHSAAQMAQNGDNAAKILSKFFPDTYIFNLSTMPKTQSLR